jgi:hypothetical protein
LPDVEGGILPPGKTDEIIRISEYLTIGYACVFPPGWKPGSTAGRMPAATAAF